jgi:hypothetical protein
VKFFACECEKREIKNKKYVSDDEREIYIKGK